ncbi:DUF4190 domain-containing protein [Flavobacterium reichenbachii]|uniref:DUF4190 domain-containing protein n=1 Tax=Flavobacterium reichenbachii TaxID=362418 RepID=UPI00069022B3|nr:DUF4190 domain-containing protein [Flavobacterium reichenbachii]OXB14750.1 hypothetical protein B0A68_11905 [Flavobacterium reichenbachii]
MENKLHSSNAGQGMGIAALVLGIIAVITAFIPCFGLIAILFGVLAIVFGAIGLSQAKKENAATTLPKVGLILGVVATCFVILWMVIFAGALGSAAWSHKDDIEKAMDSINTEAIKVQDSVENSVEIKADTVKVE